MEAQRNWNEVRARVKCQLARQQLEAGAFDEAVATAQEAMRLDPSDPAAFVVAAQAFIEKGDWTSATRIVESAERGETRRSAQRSSTDSSKAPASWAELLYLRGVIYERQGQFGEAARVYRRTRQMAPSDVQYLVAEVECLVADGHMDDAKQLLTTEARRGGYPLDGTIELLSAQIAQLQGDAAAAAAHLRTAMDQVDDDAMIAGRYGSLLAKIGRHAEAIAVLQPLVEQKGADAPPSLVRNLAASLLALARYEQVRGLLLERVQSQPDEPWYWLLLARAAIGLSDLPTARRCAVALHRLRPGDAQASLIEGYVNWKQGDLNAAERALVSALSADSRDSLALCLMGEVLSQDGRIEAACQHFRRALQIDPSCRWAKMRLSELEPQRGPLFSGQRRVLGNP
jgi:Tfp pilus assembly protein PilF